MTGGHGKFDQLFEYLISRVNRFSKFARVVVDLVAAFAFRIFAPLVFLISQMVSHIGLLNLCRKVDHYWSLDLQVRRY
jgi:hypothetical protein